MLRWCAKHGVDVNKETIWRIYQNELRIVEAVKKGLGSPRTPLGKPAQTSLPFGKK